MNITTTKQALQSVKERLQTIINQMDDAIPKLAPASDIPKVAGFQEGVVSASNSYDNLLSYLIEDIDKGIEAVETSDKMMKEFKNDIRFDTVVNSKKAREFFCNYGGRIDIDKLPTWQLEELNMMLRQAVKLDMDYLHKNLDDVEMVLEHNGIFSEYPTIQQGFIMEMQ